MLSRYPYQQLRLMSMVLILSITNVCSSYVISFSIRCISGLNKQYTQTCYATPVFVPAAHQAHQLFFPWLVYSVSFPSSTLPVNKPGLLPQVHTFHLATACIRLGGSLTPPYSQLPKQPGWVALFSGRVRYHPNSFTGCVCQPPKFLLWRLCLLNTPCCVYALGFEPTNCPTLFAGCVH